MPDTPALTGYHWFDDVVATAVQAGWPTDWITGEMYVWSATTRSRATLHTSPHCLKNRSNKPMVQREMLRADWLVSERACQECVERLADRGVPASRKALTTGSAVGCASLDTDIRGVAQFLIDLRAGQLPSRKAALEMMHNANRIAGLSPAGFDPIGISQHYRQAVAEIEAYLYSRTATPDDTPSYRASQIAAGLMTASRVDARCRSVGDEMYSTLWDGWSAKLTDSASVEIEHAFARGEDEAGVAAACTRGLLSAPTRDGAAVELGQRAKFSVIADEFTAWVASAALGDSTGAEALDRFARAVMIPAIAERVGQVVAGELYSSVNAFAVATPTVIHHVVTPYGTDRNETADRFAKVFPNAENDRRRLIVLPEGFPLDNDTHGVWAYPETRIDVGRAVTSEELAVMLKAIVAMDTNEYHPDSTREITAAQMQAAVLLLDS